MAKAKTLEEIFTSLDELLIKMEDKDLPLEEAFKYYREGVSLIKQANDSIDRVEKKIIEISSEEQIG